MSLKLSLIVALLVVASGCIAGEKKEVVMENIVISTDAFQSGGNIPKEYTCDGGDISPGLSWSNIPAKTQSVALIVDDPDAPMGTFTHWVIYNLPADKKELPKGVPKTRVLKDGSIQGVNDFGETGYNGPCPPPGKPHRYFFKIYALDKKLEISGEVSKGKLEKAMQEHILAKGELIGRYGR
jgi:Raf kinase inhibitor-like YbhB/YbcL family protein